jgi:acyl carrier protein
MTDAELRAAVRSVLARLAPETASAHLDSAAPLRDQVDLDSMDFLNFVIGLHKACGVDIPEADYEKLGTVDEIVAYLMARMGRSADDADVADGHGGIRSGGIAAAPEGRRGVEGGRPQE